MKIKRSRSAPEGRDISVDDDGCTSNCRNHSKKGVIVPSPSLSLSQVEFVRMVRVTAESSSETSEVFAKGSSNATARAEEAKSGQVESGVIVHSERSIKSLHNSENEDNVSGSSEKDCADLCTETKFRVTSSPTSSFRKQAGDIQTDICVLSPGDVTSAPSEHEDSSDVIDGVEVSEMEWKVEVEKSSQIGQSLTDTPNEDALVSAVELVDLQQDDISGLNEDLWICTVCFDCVVRISVDVPEENGELTEQTSRPEGCVICSGIFCLNCRQTHCNTRIYEGFTVIYCPGDSCTRVIPDEELKRYATESAFTIYLKNRVEIENDPRRKTCPGCSKIHTFVEDDIPKRVECQACHLHWCVPCYAPWHGNMTCKEFQKDINRKGGGRKALKSWAKSKGKVAANAKKCPKCKFYIERISGCDQMTCNRCKTDFCYRCGKRHISVGLLGNHYSTYSFLGCKYNLLPHKPVSRFFVRSSVLFSYICLAPIAATCVVAAGGLVLAASPVIASVYVVIKCKQL